METVEMACRYAASADDVWRIVGDFGSDALIKGFVERVEVSGEGVGATRTYHLAKSIGEGYVVERLERLDNHDRVMEYSIVDYGPLPFTDYSGRISVKPAGQRACTVMLRTSFFPVDADAATCTALSRNNISIYFENLRQALGA